MHAYDRCRATIKRNWTAANKNETKIYSDSLILNFDFIYEQQRSYFKFMRHWTCSFGVFQHVCHVGATRETLERVSIVIDVETLLSCNENCHTSLSNLCVCFFSKFSTSIVDKWQQECRKRESISIVCNKATKSSPVNPIDSYAIDRHGRLVWVVQIFKSLLCPVHRLVNKLWHRRTYGD